MAQGQQFLQHDGDLDAVRRAKRIELQRVPADRQLFVVRRPGDWTVDVGELAAAGLVPDPNLRRSVFGRIGHFSNSRHRGKHWPSCENLADGGLSSLPLKESAELSKSIGYSSLLFAVAGKLCMLSLPHNPFLE
jgi:hypothetical protein